MCGKERWVWLSKFNQGFAHICKSCAAKRRKGEKSGAWRGGLSKLRDGYVGTLNYDVFFKPMAKKDGRILEHRLVMAKHLGRCLHSWEIVHHINRIKDDNRIENLQLVSDDRHKQITILENRIRHLEKRVTLLEAENIFLREENVICR